MTLTNKTVADTYKSLLRVTNADNSGANTADNLTPVTDGDGSTLPICLTARTGPGDGAQYTTTPASNTDGARVLIGTLPTDATTSTYSVVVSSEEIELNAEQAIEVSSNDEIDMFGLGKLTMSGVIQLSGTKTDDVYQFQGETGDVNVYTRHRSPDGDSAIGVLPQNVAYGSMRELGSWTDINESFRTIDFAGSIKPQYNATYSIGDNERSLRSIYISTRGTPHATLSPESMNGVNVTNINLKIGDEVSESSTDENVCTLTINSATSALKYNNKDTTIHADSDNQVVVNNLQLLTRDSSMTTSTNMNTALVTEIVHTTASTTGASTYVLPQDTGTGAMKIVVIRDTTGATSTINITDGTNNVGSSISMGNSTTITTKTYIKISTGWIEKQ